MICTKCGQEIANTATVCEHCGAEVNVGVPSVEVEKPENVINGIVGAVIGALIGGLCIVLLYQMDTIASISGIILAFCTLKGYELLGGKLSKFGMVISAILILAMPFCAYVVSTAMYLMEEMKTYLPNLNIFDSIELMFEMMELDSTVSDAVVSDVLDLYLYTGIGVVAYIASRMSKKAKAKK